MGDHLRLRASKGEESGGDGSSIQQSLSRGDETSNPDPRPALNNNTEGAASPSLKTNAVAPPEHGLHRYETLPIRGGSSANRPDGTSPDTQRRGRTISSRPRDAPPLSPRSQLFRRNPSNAGGRAAEDRIGSIPEGGRGNFDVGSPRALRRSNTSADGRFSSPGMRPRVSTMTGRPRGSTINRRPSIAVAAVTSGREQDAQSVANFSMAGPAPVDTLAANQAYVDPGYSQLTPAYEQPVNTRPVWGLAKPLPRVIRPGMVPTRSEVNLASPIAQQPAQDPANVDLEQGRIESTLKVNKITSQLQNTREQRENNLLRTLSRTEGPAVSGLRRDPLSVAGHLSPTSEAIEEEEDLGMQPLDPREDHPVEEKPEQQPQQDWFSDDAASAITEHEHEGDLDGDYLRHEDIPLPAYDAEADEIHNLHTHWSVIRLRFREPLAELLAVTVQLTLGFCADLTVTTSNNKSGNEATDDWAWGLATMVGIYIAGGISGAHLNPSISIMLYIYRGFPLRKIPIYHQVWRSRSAEWRDIKQFITFPRYDWIDAGTAFFTEFTGTAILAVAVLALGDDTNAPPGAGMNAFILGLVVTVCSMAFGYNTGAAMNPSRDLGPRFAALAVGYGSQVFTNGYWVYGPWAATITGAIFGAFLYDAAIFVGGESPVNYPRRRIKRVGHKWKKKWGARFRGYRRRIRQKGEVDDGFGNGEKMGDGKKASL